MCGIICTLLFSTGIYYSENPLDIERYLLSHTAVLRKQWPKMLANSVFKGLPFTLTRENVNLYVLPVKNIHYNK